MEKLKLLLCAVVLVGLGVTQAQAEDVVLRNTPCRLYDSRNVGGAGLGAKITTATVLTKNAPGGSQGGESGCGVPDDASAVVVNIVAFDPNGSGYGRLWAYGATEPLSTSINSTGAMSENTGLLVHLGTDGKMSFHSSYTGHLIVDLVGYAVRLPTEIYRGAILSIETGSEDGEPWTAFELDTLPIPVSIICSQPWADPEACEFFGVNDEICGVGHLQKLGATNEIYAHTMTDCQ